MAVYFSGNIGDVDFWVSNKETVRVIISYSDNTVRFMKQSDESGKISLRLGEIAEGLAATTRPPIKVGEQTNNLDELLVWFETPDGEERALKYQAYIILGGVECNELFDDEFVAQKFLSVRPKQCYTHRQSREIISFINIENANVSIAAIFSDGSSAMLAFWMEQEQDDMYALIDKECSFDVVSSWFERYGKTISGYKLCINEEQVLEFVPLQTTPSASFVFLNSLGGWDTIYAYGKASSLQIGDIETFIHNNIEQEFSNRATDYWEINTGFIQTLEEERFWREFLRSTNRYIQLNGEFKRIVIDEYKAEKDSGSLGSFTFKYHMANQQFLLTL